VPPCFVLVEHFGANQNHQLSTWDFSWGSPHPPMGHSLGVSGGGDDKVNSNLKVMIFVHRLFIMLKRYVPFIFLFPPPT
jgi:hypothetical protein